MRSRKARAGHAIRSPAGALGRPRGLGCPRGPPARPEASRRSTSHQRRIGLADDEGHAGLGDPRLLAGNQLESVAQILHVVASDLGYSAHQRADHVGAVESSAEPDLDHRDLDSPCRKVRKGESRRGLEEGRLPFQNGRQEPAGPHGHRFFRDGNTIDLNSLPERDQMRRGIQAHPPAGFAQRGGNQSRTRCPSRWCRRYAPRA